MPSGTLFLLLLLRVAQIPCGGNGDNGNGVGTAVVSATCALVVAVVAKIPSLVAQPIRIDEISLARIRAGV